MLSASHKAPLNRYRDSGYPSHPRKCGLVGPGDWTVAEARLFKGISSMFSKTDHFAMMFPESVWYLHAMLKIYIMLRSGLGTMPVKLNSYKFSWRSNVQLGMMTLSAESEWNGKTRLCKTSYKVGATPIVIGSTINISSLNDECPRVFQVPDCIP